MTPPDSARMLLKNRSGRYNDPTTDVLLDLWCEHGGREIPQTVGRLGYRTWRRYAARGRTPWMDEDPLLIHWPLRYPPGFMPTEDRKGREIPAMVFRASSPVLSGGYSEWQSRVGKLPPQIIPNDVLAVAISLAAQQREAARDRAGNEPGEPLVQVLASEHDRRQEVMKWFFSRYLPAIFRVIGEQRAYDRFLENYLGTSTIPLAIADEEFVYRDFRFRLNNFLTVFFRERMPKYRGERLPHPAVRHWVEVLPYTALRLIYPSTYDQQFLDETQGLRNWIANLLGEAVQKIIPEVPWNFRVKSDVALALDPINRFQAPLEKELYGIATGWYT